MTNLLFFLNACCALNELAATVILEILEQPLALPGSAKICIGRGQTSDIRQTDIADTRQNFLRGLISKIFEFLGTRTCSLCTIELGVSYLNINIWLRLCVFETVGEKIRVNKYDR